MDKIAQEVVESFLNNPVFEIIEPSGNHVKIWQDGRVEGIQGVVVNKIPSYVEFFKRGQNVRTL